MGWGACHGSPPPCRPLLSTHPHSGACSPLTLPPLLLRMQVLQAEAEKRHPLWDIRTHKEAEQFWRRTFGHLTGEARQPGDEADGAHHSGRPTLV